MSRNRVLYLILIAGTITLGLLSRKFGYYLPEFVNTYIGDSLWALMIFLIFGFTFPKHSSSRIAFISIIFCFIIEISQLYHAPWIASVRATKLGGLILGFGFLWTDLIAYCIGITVGFTLETLIHKLTKKL